MPPLSLGTLYTPHHHEGFIKNKKPVVYGGYIDQAHPMEL